MEYQINSKLSEKNKNFFKFNNGKTRNIFKLEENKNHNKYKNNNIFNNNYNDKILTPRNLRNDNIYPLLYNNLYSCKNNNNKITFFKNHNNINNNLIIDASNRYKNDTTLVKNSSTSNLLNDKTKNVNIYKGLNRNRSTVELLNKKIYILPAIKPRKIIINYCSGQYDLQISDINKKNFNNKKYGHNTFFMGDNYNPQNYEIKQVNRLSRNYYGKLFAN